jgi:hypothetical protein
MSLWPKARRKRLAECPPSPSFRLALGLAFKTRQELGPARQQLANATELHQGWI